ncbi:MULTISPECIES: CitMHS family transporter [unclassified Pseudomonas]|uniref:CitMHS family transporter n=1 Tax=unclassified Pseudomonas TaxID=196821 RepID=UPI0015A2E5D2|nr:MULTISPECIES: citrate:proton symporter [unclassified Pseudomonas]NWC96048.1 citrate transporter [Pseudomonas sp. IPO3779]NWD18759.1 citrate transporter [Pseudomonas sp. IPO3778]
MLTLIGLITILSLVVLLLIGRMSPILPLIVVPLLGALFAGFGPAEISGFFTDGIGRVTPIATMFIFAITFFGVMQDTGLFRPVIGFMVRLTRGNVIAVAVATALIGMLAHLDGAGATTFLLTIPALLPLYKQLRMSPYLMLMLLAIGAGILNMVPWAGPLGRSAAVTGLDVTDLWRPLIPVQGFGVVLLIALAALLGWREQRRIMAAGGAAMDDGVLVETTNTLENISDAERALERPKRLWFNAGLFVLVLTSLFLGVLPAGYIFMLGLTVALMINYPGGKVQMQRIAAHSAAALSMGMIILAAGSMLGIFAGTGMLTSIAKDLVQVLPESMVGQLHIVLGLFGLPMELMLSTDAYYFGLMPVTLEVVENYGVQPASVVYALMIGNIIGTFISPFSPALWLALGLAGLDLGRHIRYSFWWMWGFSLVLFGIAWALGLF